MPMSSGTNENASATALPTRNVSAAAARGAEGKALAASRSTAAINLRNGALMARLRVSRAYSFCAEA